MIDGLVLSGLRPSFAAPELDPELGIAHCLTPDSLAAALEATPGAVAAMVVSPTYFGACADVAGLAEVAHERGVPLAVDEAWGAHLRFHPDLPPDALGCGADLVVSSTHKIVGSLTQAAMLHLGGGGRIDERGRRPLRQPGRDDQPQRPARRLARRRQAAGLGPRGARCSTRRWPAIAATREAIEEIPGLAVLDDGMVGRAGIAGWDPLRLAIDVRGTGADRLPAGEAAFATTPSRLRARRREPRRRDLRARRAGRAAGERLVAALRVAVERLGEGEPEHRTSRWRRRPPGGSWR